MFISSIKWIPAGVLKNMPENVGFNETELKEIITDGVEKVNDNNNDENSDLEVDTENKNVEDEYDMENYDDEDGTLTASLKNIVQFDDTTSKKRKKNSVKQNDSSDSEDEDDRIKEDDNILLMGRVDDYMSTIEVHVYNHSTGDFYIHHDYMLKSAPLCIEYLNLETDSGPTNLCAVGLTSPVIELWDIDMMNSVEPLSKLGRHRTKSPEKNFGHTDAVLSVAWNKCFDHILCSGSVDETALLWDLEVGKVNTAITVFGGDVQSLSWSPHDSTGLLSACKDGKLRYHDCHVYDEFTEMNLSSSVESILWHPNKENLCFAGTEDGRLHIVDWRKPDKSIYSYDAHQKELTGIALLIENGDKLVTTSTDELVKIWNIAETKEASTLIYQQNFKLESIHCIDVNPDHPYIMCIAGSSKTSDKKMTKVLNVQNLLHEEEKPAAAAAPASENVQQEFTKHIAPALLEPKSFVKSKKPKKIRKKMKKPSSNKQKIKK